MSTNDKVLTAGKVPLRSKVWSEADYQSLDRGIRFAVRVLHAHGVETGQSCEGGKGHAYFEPTIEFRADADDALGFEALSHLQMYALPVSAVAIHWHIFRGLPFEKLWRITFWKKMDERADEQPGIIWGYQFQPDQRRKKHPNRSWEGGDANV